MTTNVHTQLVSAVCLLDCIIPNHIILTALARPNRQLHCLHTLGRADIRHHHIKALRSFILNVNRASHAVFGFFHLSRSTRYTLQTTVRLNIVHVNVVLATIIFMTTNVHIQLVSAVCLLGCIVPDHIILTALARPNRQLHCFHTLGGADIRYHHIKALRGLIFNVNRASHLNRFGSFFIC